MADQLSISEHNQLVMRTLKPGDKVAYDRGPYYHYGIYKGEGKVIHKAGDGRTSGWSHRNSTFSGCGVRSDKSEIKEDSFSKVANGSLARKDNAKDEKYSPRRQKDIIKAAEAMKGERQGYNVFNNNCETFVNDCRYGKPESDQGSLLAAAVIIVGAIVVGAGALIGYFVSSSRSEKNKATQ